MHQGPLTMRRRTNTCAPSICNVGFGRSDGDFSVRAARHATRDPNGRFQSKFEVQIRCDSEWNRRHDKKTNANRVRVPTRPTHKCTPSMRTDERTHSSQRSVMKLPVLCLQFSQQNREMNRKKTALAHSQAHTRNCKREKIERTSIRRRTIRTPRRAMMYVHTFR